MNELISKIEALIESDIKNIVDERIAEFERFRKASSADNFKELCFCILTANCSAEMCLRVHEAIGDKFLTVENQEEFTRLLKANKYRFYNLRANYLVSCCGLKENLKEIMDSHEDEIELREWLVKNVKGLGYKEASHFLRNVGYENVAIIDFHIVDVLKHHRIVDKPKTMTKKKYLEIEKELGKIAKKLGITLASLDLYLWYMETGKILK
ncbi:MAG: N-glycosylase/DNA lyase [Candidatus Hodarchaeota archaeon]